MGLLLYWQDLRVHHGVCECELVLIRGNFHKSMCMSFKCVSLFDCMRIQTVQSISLAPVRSVPATAFQALNGLRLEIAPPVQPKGNQVFVLCLCNLMQIDRSWWPISDVYTDFCAWLDANYAVNAGKSVSFWTMSDHVRPCHAYFRVCTKATLCNIHTPVSPSMERLPTNPFELSAVSLPRFTFVVALLGCFCKLLCSCRCALQGDLEIWPK